MSIFVVQAGSADEAGLLRARFIRDGFSWPAVVFGPLWLLYRRLWIVAIVYVILAGAFLFIVAPHLSSGAAFGIWLLARLFLGFEGNRWRQAAGARAMPVQDLVEARDRDEAEAIFYARHGQTSREIVT